MNGHVHALLGGGIGTVQQALAQGGGKYAGAAQGGQRAGEHVAFGLDGA